MIPIRRRVFLAGALGAVSATAGGSALALGRTPLGGTLVLRLPWPTGSIDPHDVFDPAAALFGSAVADAPFALDAAGVPYASLAASMPSREGAETVVRLREGLRTARNLPLDGKDLVASIERARERGASAVLAEVPPAKLHPADPLAVTFRGADPSRVARALASPLCALVPRRFDPGSPDGTGPFRATPSARTLELARNVAAARGHSFLEKIRIESAPDLKASLRAFETEQDDVGWLGTGLFEGRKGAARFDLGRAGWIVLATGGDAGSFGQPGVAQQMCDALPGERLAHLGLGTLPPARGEARWGGPPAELLVDESCVHLVEVARAVAPILSRPQHEITILPVGRVELARRWAKGAALAVRFVRPVAPGAAGTLLSLAMADDAARAKEIAKRPPRLDPNASARSLTSTLRVGVIGELRVFGGVVPDVVLAKSAGGDGWDLGASFRKARASAPPR